jgi:DNA polymerase-3 subunit alpha
MSAYLFLDVETTGTNPTRNDIIQLAAIIVIDGVRQLKTFNQHCQPMDWATIEDEALNVNGITRDQLLTFQSLPMMLEKFVSFVKDATSEKLIMAGYCVSFDRSFVSSSFHKIGKDDLFRSLFKPDIHDVHKRAKAAKEQLGIKSLKLVNVAAVLGIELDNAHDALADINATVLVDEALGKMLEDDGIVAIPLDKISFNLPEIPHLHLHSEYSYRDSVSSIDDWIEWAKQNKVSGIAFPDHDIAASTYKAIRSSTQDFTVVPAVSFLLDINGDKSWCPRINAWATSNDGYKHIIKLASSGWDNKYTVDDKVSYPAISLADLNGIKDVVFGSGCEKGLLCQDNNTFSYEEGLARVKKVTDVVGHSNLVLELLPFDIVAKFDSSAGFKGISKTPQISDGNLSKAINILITQLVDKNKYKHIISTSAHFIMPEDKMIQDVVSRSAFKDGRYFHESRHQRTTAECYTVLVRHLGGWFNDDSFIAAAQNAEEIVNKAKNIKIKYDYHLPKIKMPIEITNKTSDYDLQLYYFMMTKIKEHGRWSDDPVYLARFKKELDVIWKNKTLNFIPYFLIYEDIGSFARDNGILQGIARGSAGGSLISYYLRIIHIDPIKENLPFERFLSHARINAGSFPDIDSDYAFREPILAYLKEKYNVGFAQIGTLLTFKTKNAIKDAMYSIYGRNRADSEILSLCNTIEDSPQGIDELQFLYGYTDSEGEHHRGHLEKNTVLQAFFKQYPEAASIVKRLIGLPRATGRHASGFVISSIDIAAERIPIMFMDDGTDIKMPVTQYEAAMVDKSGLIKADILGVTTIGTITECIKLIKTRSGLDYLEENDNGIASIYRLPEDTAVYEDFYYKRTDSSFQFNTGLIKSLIQEFAPLKRSDLSNLTALARPGALDVQVEDGVSATQWYMDVRNNKRSPKYIHPDLESILAETNSVICFQEQLMEILVKFCGYSLEESDVIRSAIAKKKKDVMTKAFEKVRIETVKLGWTLDQAEELCKVLTAYSNYSFNRSHSRAYGELGYITMYLKHNHPLEWWCAELNSCLDKNNSEEKIRSYTILLGSMIVPPTLSRPSNRFEIHGDKINAPLSIVKGIGAASIAEIMKHGSYSSLREFATKVSPRCNGGHFAALVRARVADDFMDKTIPYAQARVKLLQEYTEIKKCKPLPNDVSQVDPLSIFLAERSANKCFNKTLMADDTLLAFVKSQWSLLRSTNKKAIPLMMGSVPIVGSVKAARAILEKQDEIEIGFIGLYCGSEVQKGIGKASGKPWSKLEISISDGIEVLRCDWWRKDKALRLPIDSIFYVKGKLKLGWRDMPVIEVQEVQRLGEEE